MLIASCRAMLPPPCARVRAWKGQRHVFTDQPCCIDVERFTVAARLAGSPAVPRGRAATATPSLRCGLDAAAAAAGDYPPADPAAARPGPSCTAAEPNGPDCAATDPAVAAAMPHLGRRPPRHRRARGQGRAGRCCLPCTACDATEALGGRTLRRRRHALICPQPCAGARREIN